MNSSKKYKILEVLGKGSQGIVYKCSKRSRTTEIYAMKRIMVTDINEANEAIDELNNVRTLLPHDHIANYEELILDNHERMILVCIILEFYESDLEKYISKIYIDQKSKLEEMTILQFMNQLSSTLHFLHSKNVIHRDLKPANIFMKNVEVKAIPDLVVGDFGLATNFSENSLKSTFCGSPMVIAPEMLKGSYNEKCDIFSLGSIAYKLATGKEKMFYIELMRNKEKILEEMRKELKEMNRSRFLTRLIMDMIEVEPKKRPSASDVFERVKKKLENEDFDEFDDEEGEEEKNYQEEMEEEEMPVEEKKEEKMEVRPMRVKKRKRKKKERSRKEKEKKKTRKKIFSKKSNRKGKPVYNKKAAAVKPRNIRWKSKGKPVMSESKKEEEKERIRNRFDEEESNRKMVNMVDILNQKNYVVKEKRKRGRGKVAKKLQLDQRKNEIMTQYKFREKTNKNEVMMEKMKQNDIIKNKAKSIGKKKIRKWVKAGIEKEEVLKNSENEMVHFQSALRTDQFEQEKRLREKINKKKRSGSSKRK